MTWHTAATRKGKRARLRTILTRTIPLAVLGLGVTKAMVELVTAILKLIAQYH
jgi:hypothetical protein